MLSQVALRSLVFLGRKFGLGYQKRPENRPDTSRLRNRPETVPSASLLGGTLASRKAPRRYAGKAGLEGKAPRWYACKSLLCLKSDAQLLSQIAHRSLVFLGRIFGLGHPKPFRKPSATNRFALKDCQHCSQIGATIYKYLKPLAAPPKEGCLATASPP